MTLISSGNLEALKIAVPNLLDQISLLTDKSYRQLEFAVISDLTLFARAAADGNANPTEIYDPFHTQPAGKSLNVKMNSNLGKSTIMRSLISVNVYVMQKKKVWVQNMWNNAKNTSQTTLITDLHLTTSQKTSELISVI